MKLSVKLFLIVLVGGIVTLFIYSNVSEDKTTVVALGDGVALGMTPYNMIGTSYNDYLKEYYENKGKLASFNNEFSIQHLSMDDLVDLLEENGKSEKSKEPFQQIIAQADIVTLAIGMDEFVDLSIKNKINEDKIQKFLKNYETFLKNIRLFYDKEFVLIGLYPAYDFDRSTVIDINKKLQEFSVTYKCRFLDILALSLNDDYYVGEISYYMNYKGHQAIFNQLLNYIK